MKTRFEHKSIVLDATGQTTDALLVEDGIVVAVGHSAREQDAEEVVSLEGAVVVPGLCDAHIHLWGLGQRSAGSPVLDLRSCRSASEVLALLKDATPFEDWIFGIGWNENHWGGSTLTLESLDRLFPSQPVCLRRVDGHAVWANSCALRRAGITASSSFAGGEVVCVDGKMTGLLVDTAMEPVVGLLPATPQSEDLAVFKESSNILRGFGVTVAHKAWMPANRMQMLEGLRIAGDLPLRLTLMLDGTDPDFDSVFEAGPFGDLWLQARTAKFFADGAMGSRGARLHRPYRDAGLGVYVHDRDLLSERVPKLTQAGWQIAVHAIGDAGADMVLDVYEHVPADLRDSLRLRLEHAQMLTDSAVERIGALGVVASIQCIHMRGDAAWVDEVLDAEQLDELFRWRDLQDCTHVCGGSDFPIEDPNPWHGMATAMNREDARGRVFHVKQRLSFEEAFASYTTGAAYAAHQEAHLGKLGPGYQADFAVLDRHPWKCTPEEVWETQCLMSAIAGRISEP